MYEASQRRPGMSPGYQHPGQGPGPGHPGQQYGPQQQQFSPNSTSPRGYPQMQGQPGRPGLPGMPYGQQMPPQYGQQEAQGPYGPQGQHFIGQQSQSSQQSQPGPQVANMMGQTPPQQAQQPPQTATQSLGQAQQQPPPTPTSQQSAAPQQQQQLPQQSNQMQHQQNQHQQSMQQQQQLPQPPPQQPPQQQPQQQQQGQQQSNAQDSVSNNSTDENGGDVGNSANSRATPTSQGPQHPAVSALRPTPSPVGSAGSRSNTPASVTGNQAGSPMPPRPPSAQVDGQNRIQSPMATQSYPQQMMPPTMGHGGMGQMGFNSSKMHPNMMGGPQMGQFPQQNSQYPNQPQGQFGRSPGMPGYSGQPNSFPPNAQNPMYPGTAGMPGMNRSLPNANYPSGYHPQGNNMSMNNQYGQYNNAGTPPGMPPNQSVPSSGMPNAGGMPNNAGMPNASMQHTPSPMNSMATHINNMGMTPATSAPSDLQIPGPKGAQAAAQAAMLAAANCASRAQMLRQQPGSGSATTPPAQPQTSPVPQLSPPQGSQHGPSSQAGPPPGAPPPGAPPPGAPPPGAPPQQPPVASRGMYGQYMSGQGAQPPHGPPGQYGPMGQMPGQSGSQIPPHMDGMAPGVGQGHGNGPVHLGFVGSLGNMPNTSQSMATQDIMAGPGAQMGPGMHSHNSMPGGMGSIMGPHGPHGPNQLMPGSSSGMAMPNSTMPGSMHPNMGPPGIHTGTATNSRSATPQMIQAGPILSNSTNSNERDGKSPVSDSDKATTVSSAGNASTTVTQSITSPVTNATESTPSNTPPTVTASVLPSSKMTPVMPPPPPPRESGTDSQGENSNDEPPEKRMKTENASHPPTPASVAPSPSASMSSVHDEFENISSPSWPGTPVSVAPTAPTAFTQALTEATGERPYQKPGNEGANKLYDMGDEPDRRSFLDKLFAYMDDKGSPITAMPTISKQPIDLFKLYVLVKEKGGIVEVTKQKKWRDICSSINIGSSGSAGFTLRKNYIKYLLAFECKFEHGGIDPAPIVAQLESMSDKKSKNRANQSPAVGQGPIDFRGQQGFDGFPQQPPHAMMPNQNMMPNSGMQPGYGDPMMTNAGMPPNTSVIPNNSMMPNSTMPNSSMMPNASIPNSMIPNSGSQHQMLPNQNMMPNNSGDTVSVTDPFADNAPNMGNSQFPRQGMTTQLPPYSSGGGMPQQNSNMSNAGFPGYNRPGMGTNMPSSGYPQGISQSGQFAEGMTRQMPTQSEQYPNDPYRRGMAPGLDGFPSRGMQQGQESFPNQYSGNRIMSQGGAQYSFNDRYNSSSQQGQSSSMMGSQAMRPASQPGMGPAPSGDQMITGRYSGQSMPPRPHTPQEQFGPQGMPTPPPQGVASPAPTQTYPAQRQYGVPAGEQYPGYQQQGQGMYPGQKPTSNMTGYQQKRYENYNMPPGYTASQTSSGPYGDSGSYPGSASYGDSGSYSESGSYGDHSQYHGYSGGPSLPSSRRPMSSADSMHSAQGGNRDQQWSRYPSLSSANYHQGGSPIAGQMPQNSPSGPPFAMYNRPMNRVSPQRPDKFGSPPKMQKQQSGQNTFPPKKEIVFPPDSIEAVQPVLNKRRRITQKDIGTTDPWRLMMALKSGLLAESTWALDTLSILLFDDNTISFFHLQHLPGLLDVLLDHFRCCLINIFSDKFNDMEIKTEGELKQLHQKEEVTNSEDDKGIKGLDISPPDSEKLEQPDNFTLVTRHGMAVKIEKDSEDAEVLFDEKGWDVHTNYDSSAKDWLMGCADRTDHIHTHFADTDMLEFYKKQFFGRNRKHVPLKREQKKSVQKEKCKENGGCVSGEVTEQDEENTDQKGRESVKNDTNDSSNTSSTELAQLDTNPVINNTHSTGPLSSYSNKSSSTSSGAMDNANNSSNCTDYLTNVQIKTEPPDLIGVDENSKPPTESRKENEAHNSNKDVCSDETAGDCETSSSSTLYTASVPSSEGDGDKNSSVLPTKCKVKEEADEKAAGVKEESEEGKPAESPDTNSEDDKESNDEPTPEELARLQAYQRHLEERKTNDAAQKVVEQLRQQWEDGDADKEAYHHDQPHLCILTDAQEHLARRCVCISNIFRSLSFVPGNDLKMSEHCGLMRVLGRLLLLHHWHPNRPREQQKFEREDCDGPFEDILDDGCEEWWWDTLEELRENTLVIYANIAGKLSLSKYPESVCLPILDGLLHWSVCSSACAQDPLPNISSSSVLSPQRLVLEALCKLCIQEQNVDLLLATPPFSRIVELLTTLIQLLANRKEQVMREFAIVLLSSLVAGDQCATRVVALTHPAIPLLVDFLETSEHQALQIANSHGVDMLRENPEMMGTSLGMLRRAANTLLHLAEVLENTSLFVHQQQRLLQLVMSQILDQNVASILADVLYHCSQVS